MKSNPDRDPMEPVPLDAEQLATRATALDLATGYFQTAPRKDNWFFLYDTLPPHQARLVVAYLRGGSIELLLDAFGIKARAELKERLSGAMHRIYLKGSSDPCWAPWAMEYFRRLRLLLSLEP